MAITAVVAWKLAMAVIWPLVSGTLMSQEARESGRFAPGPLHDEKRQSCILFYVLISGTDAATFMRRLLSGISSPDALC